MQKIVSLLTRSDDEVGRLLSQRAPLTAHDCYQAAVSHFRTTCFNWHSSTVSPGLWGPPAPAPQLPWANLAFPCRFKPKRQIDSVHWKSQQMHYLVEGSIQAHSKAFDGGERKKVGQLH